MDDGALYSVINGQQAFNNSWGRPKLEIPKLEPATPRRRSGQSPRGIYEFPNSPQSPGDSLLYNSSSPLKGCLRARRLWVQDPMDSTVTAMSPSFSPQYNSPFTNHPGHGFGECGAECGRNGAQRLSSLMGYAFGENVLVRCNQTKWLVGQVQRISNSGMKVWIGTAQILVNIPVDLFSTHLAHMDCTTPPPSPTESESPGLQNGPVAVSDVKARVHIVRPAHLSHRRLYQHSAPCSPVSCSAADPHQMLPTQFAPLTPTDSRTNVESYDHRHPPQATTCPLNLPERVAAYFEKKGDFPRLWPTLKSVNGLSEPLNALREEGGSTRNVHEKEPSPDPQVYRSSEHHGLPKPQQGKRPSYPRPFALPLLNLNLNEGTQMFRSPTLETGSHPSMTPTSSSRPHERPYNIFAGSPVFSATENTQVRSSSLVTPKGDVSNSGQASIRSLRSPVPSRVYYAKDKAICDEGNLGQRWPDAMGSSKRGQVGLQLENPVSLNSYDMCQMPAFPGLPNPCYLKPRLAKDATPSAEPTWVTVIENGHGIRKEQVK